MGRFLPPLVLLLCLQPAAARAAGPADPPVSFNRDVRPIFADNCFACHGPDKNQRKADLRLDTEEGARADRGGYAPIVAGKPEESELHLRLTATDDKQRMPPAKSGKRLTSTQIERIRRWIEQ